MIPDLFVLSTTSSDYLDQLRGQLIQQVPFSYLSADAAHEWLSQAKLLRLKPGQTLLSNRQLQDRIYLVLEGKVRLLAENENDINTLQLRGSGQFVGWVSLLRMVTDDLYPS